MDSLNATLKTALMLFCLLHQALYLSLFFHFLFQSAQLSIQPDMLFYDVYCLFEIIFKALAFHCNLQLQTAFREQLSIQQISVRNSNSSPEYQVGCYTQLYIVAAKYQIALQTEDTRSSLSCQSDSGNLRKVGLARAHGFQYHMKNPGVQSIWRDTQVLSSSFLWHHKWGPLLHYFANANQEPYNQNMFTDPTQALYKPGGPSGGAGQKKVVKPLQQIFTPVTLKMIDDCVADGMSDALVLGEHFITDVIVCGRLISKTEEMLRIGFEINDNSGCCPIIFFQKDQSSRPQALKDFHYEQFAYVKIFGTVRVFKETKAIVGTNIKRIVKYSEVTNHLLQTFVSHQVRTQGALTSQELNNEDPAKGKRTSNPVTLGVKQSSSVDDSMQTVVQIMREMVKRSDVRMLHIKDVYAVVSHVQEWELFKETIDRLLREGTIVQQSEQNSDIILLSE